MKLLPALVAAFALATSVARAEWRTFYGNVAIDVPSSATVVNLGAYGYSIQLPRSAGFSPNLNIQLQAYPYSIRSYAALSMRQFRGLGFHVHYRRLWGSRAWDVEYTGRIGRQLHFFGRAVKASGGGVILITATALPSQWGRVWSADSAPLFEMLNTARFR